MKTFGKWPDELELDNLNPVMLAWMQHSWAEDYTEQWKLLENNSYLTGSFINPEAVKQMLGKDGQTSFSTEEEFEETYRMVSEYSKKAEEEKLKLYPRKRRRKMA